jgi:VanZ family protein
MSGLRIAERVSRGLLATALVTISVLALIPQQALPVTTLWDKADHALAFLVLGLLARRAFPGLRYWQAIAPALLAYGVTIELLQVLTATRVGSAADVVANLAGLLLADIWLHCRRVPDGRPANER